MPGIDLQVAFTDKEQVKQLGARWDVKRKVWFIPDGVDTNPFQKWLPKKLDINIRSSNYFIVKSVTEKPKFLKNGLMKDRGLCIGVKK